ncbi:hypothetical protein WME79_08495 [Sorangium sp. So ce726]|uniref:hypothetical protein n=1 Tax=Sorangium sp. So ce726 TaxID=3133319 RepID=UPI003F5EE342
MTEADLDIVLRGLKRMADVRGESPAKADTRIASIASGRFVAVVNDLFEKVRKVLSYADLGGCTMQYGRDMLINNALVTPSARLVFDNPADSYRDTGQRRISMIAACVDDALFCVYATRNLGQAHSTDGWTFRRIIGDDQREEQAFRDAVSVALRDALIHILSEDLPGVHAGSLWDTMKETA